MKLDLKYDVTVASSDHFFEVGIKIPKNDIDLSKRNAHEINMTFNQIIIFAEAMGHHSSGYNQEVKKSFHKIVTDLRQISKEVCWIKSIHQAIKNKAIELAKGSK